MALSSTSSEQRAWPSELEVIIEVPRGGFIKRTDAGTIDYVSPFPCPFNYGSVPDTRSGDGDRLDVVVLGPSLKAGTRVRGKVVGLVRFTDAGEDDPKLICSDAPPTTRELRTVTGFFRRYAFLKGALNFLRRKSGATRYGGFTAL